MGLFINRSVDVNLRTFGNYVNNILDTCNQFDVTYTDFAKAFEKVYYDILLKSCVIMNFS